MTTLKFADTYNMVAFLAKPAKSEGFEQIVDFLNAHTIKYALTVNPTIYTSCIEPFWATVKEKIVNEEVQLQALVDGKKIIITESIVRRDLQLEDAEDEAINEEMDDSLVRATTTASSLEAKQDSGNINKTQSKATLNEPSSSGTSSGSGPRGNTLRSGEDSLKLQELIALFKKLERRKKSRTRGLKRLYKIGSSRRVESSEEEGLGEEDASKQGRISDIDDDAEITLVSTHFDADTDMFGVHDLDGDMVVVESKARASKKRNVEEVVDVIDTASTILVSVATTITTTTIITDDEITLAKALAELKSAKPPTQAASTRPKDKGKGKMVEPEKTMKKKELIRLDEENASKLQAEFDEEAKIKADHELAQRLQVQEQEELSDVEKATLFIQLLEKRRKHFAAKRAEEKRNKPPTQAQQRKIMYLVEGSSKRAGEELEQENVKKQKVGDDKEIAELKSLIEVMPDEEEVALDAIPLAVKSPSIVDWKIHKEGKKSYYQIIRVNGSLKMYLVFSHMLKSFDRKDLETLYKLVKAMYGSTRLVKDLDLVLYGDLKTMFEPHVEDNV
ncbi:hypothetical protein Tco_0716494 [Tanacetum coccineum]